MIKTMKIKLIHKNIKYKKYKIITINIEIRMKLNIIKLYKSKIQILLNKKIKIIKI